MKKLSKKQQQLLRMDGLYAVETIAMVNEIARQLGKPDKPAIAAALLTTTNLILN